MTTYKVELTGPEWVAIHALLQEKLGKIKGQYDAVDHLLHGSPTTLTVPLLPPEVAGGIIKPGAWLEAAKEWEALAEKFKPIGEDEWHP